MLFGIQIAKAQLPSTDPAYYLAFVDSFPTIVPNSVKIDTSKWDQMWPWNQADSVVPNCDTSIHTDVAYKKWYEPTHGDNHLYIDTTNFQVKGDTLNLWSRKETYSGSCWTFPHCGGPTVCNGGYCNPTDSLCLHTQNRQFAYTNALLISKYRFRYGYFEMKFKLPAAAPSGKKYSCGPTFWLYADYNDSTHNINYSEIDIFEIWAYNNLYTSNVHYEHSPHTQFNQLINQGHTLGSTISPGVHTAGCLWTSHEITYYLDNQPIYSVTKDSIKIDSLLPMPIIIENNSPAMNFCDSFVSTSAFPYDYQIKYVKVWQLKPRCSNPSIDTTLTSYSASTYKNALYHSITMTPTTTMTINNTNYQSFWGSDHILLNSGVTVNGSANTFFDVTDCNSSVQYFNLAPQPMPVSYTYKMLMHNSTQ